MNQKALSSSSRAVHFKETRLQRLVEIAEDYTELIGDLIQMQGQARVCDIAREMGISHVSVLKTLKKLIRDGYILKEEHQIHLTSKGQQMAAFSKKKHLVLSQFLIKLGVPEEIVATDVEGFEHHISVITLEAIEAHMLTL
jgi:DtxR family manganese transport transcriptional regulator